MPACAINDWSCLNSLPNLNSSAIVDVSTKNNESNNYGVDMTRNRYLRAFAVTGLAGALMTGCLSGGSSSGSSVPEPTPAPATPPDGAATPPPPDLGPNVTIFKSDTPLDEINSTLRALSAEEEFSENRRAVLFMPGVYGSDEGRADPSIATDIVNAEVGYYTAIYGLGRLPGDVQINGALHVNPVQGNPAGNPDDDTLHSDSLTQFWRSLSNLSITPIQRPVGDDAEQDYPEGIAEPLTMRWAVSQAAPLRRIHIKGDLDLTGRYGAYGFGSYISNSHIDGAVISGHGPTEKSQAHWYTRDSRIGEWDGLAVSFVFSGVEGAPATDFDPGAMTTLQATPAAREAPFLYVDDKGAYNVFAPHAKRDSFGANWSTSASDGRELPIDRFYIARPSDSAAAINQQLADGKHLLFTPGVYNLDRAIEVNRESTVVLGLGFPTLVPTRGNAAIEVGDVNGVMLAGLMIDAGAVQSDVLLRVGQRDSSAGVPQDPTTLNDIFVRIGGAREGSATTSVEINSSHVILDHAWLWRGDHGTFTDWAENRADHGLVVNGDDVTVLGLWAEHYQKHQVIWNGERGRTVFYQSEMPYDPPGQTAWMNGSKQGYASYVVSSGVRAHQGTGLAIYTLFFVPGVEVSSAIETPEIAGVRFQSIATAVIAANGGMQSIINETGQGAHVDLAGSSAYGLESVTRLKRFPE